MNQKIELTIKQEDKGKRLDLFLKEKLEDFSRSRIKKLIDDSNITINNRKTSPSYKVKEFEKVTVFIPQAVTDTPKPVDIPLDIVYEDEHLIIINKPCGMVVHPGAGNYDNTLVNALLYHCKDNLSGIGGVKRPGIVHRIDKDTSGLLVVAKDDFTHNHLSEQFSKHSIKRAYKAVIYGMIMPKEGKIETNIGRCSNDRKKMCVLESKGKKAITHYKTIKNYSINASLIECRLETGRTHQIRVHLTHMGHPLIGDQTYKKNKKFNKLKLNLKQIEAIKNFNRQALHAYELGFIHPKTGKEVFFCIDLPNDINKLISYLE